MSVLPLILSFPFNVVDGIFVPDLSFVLDADEAVFFNASETFALIELLGFTGIAGIVAGVDGDPGDNIEGVVTEPPTCADTLAEVAAFVLAAGTELTDAAVEVLASIVGFVLKTNCPLRKMVRSAS